MIRFIELFCGIGGFRNGLERCMDNRQQEQLGETKSVQKHLPNNNANSLQRTSYCCVYANDIDKYACQIYRKNFGGKELYEGDITKINANDIPDFDLLTAGFPCQSFSISGKRRGFDDTRGTLFFEIERICRIKKPRYILLENVKGLLSHESGKTFQIILKVLSDVGYVLQWQVLNSKNFGTPQNRERMFIVGHLRGECRPEVFPIGESNKVDNKQNAQRHNIAHTIQNSDKHRGSYIIHNIYGGFKEKEIRKFYDHSPTIRTPKGGGHLPMLAIHKDEKNKNFIRSWGDKIGKRHYRKDKICQCISSNPTSDNLPMMGDLKIRRLTPIECERLQGFLCNWTKEGIDKQGNIVIMSDTQRYKALGNAVTTNVITAIGEKLIQGYYE